MRKLFGLHVKQVRNTDFILIYAIAVAIVREKASALLGFHDFTDFNSNPGSQEI